MTSAFHYRRLSINLALFALLFASLWSAPGFAQGRDFKDQDLSNRNLAGQNLAGANFSGANLQWADLRNANLRGANFAEADLRMATLMHVDATGADFRNAIVALGFGADYANFSNANLEKVDFKGAKFYKVNFTNANLRGTTGWGTCSECIFRGTDLRGANLVAAEPGGPSGSKVFAGAVYDETTVWPQWVDVAASGARHAQ
jgi:uncharacterized protein YjbI with pentapeptide repeats